MHDNPIVSVLIPYYNDSSFLASSIESVLSQNFANFELILVNHASTDNSRSIAHRYDDPRIRHVDMLENNGAGGGLVVREFMRVAKGEFVKFMCADDCLTSRSLGTLVGFMTSHPEYDFAFGNLCYMDVAGKCLPEDWFSSRPHFFRGLDRIGCLRELSNGHSVLPWIGSIVRREKMAAIMLDPTMVMMFDMHVWLQLLLSGSNFGLLDEIVANYRLHPGQTSAADRRCEARAMSIFEQQIFFRCFQGLRSIGEAHEIFSESRYVQAASVADDIPVAVAIHYLCNFYGSYWAHDFLHDYMLDESRRRHLRDVFGFSVSDLRRSLVRDVKIRRKPNVWKRFWRKFTVRKDEELSL